MSARDVYYTIVNGKLVKVSENDGWTYMRRGPETQMQIVPYSKYKDRPDVQAVVKEWEKKHGRKFTEDT